MASPYEIALQQAGGRVGAARGLGSPAVRDVLGEQENPGTFETFFRFLGRPGFAVRSALTGDFKGAGANALQFLNELFMGGAVNQNWTVTSLLSTLPGVDLPKDLTTPEQRPEFSDMLGRWGVSSPVNMSAGEKLLVDMLGGIVTDPLTLLGGAPKGLAAGTFKSIAPHAFRPTAQRLAYGAMERAGGDLLKAALREEVAGNIRLAAERLGGRKDWTKLFTTATPETLTNVIAEAGKIGGASAANQAAKVVRGIQGRAAEGVFFKLANLEKIDVSRAARTFVPTGNFADELAEFMRPDSPKRFLSIPNTERVPHHIQTGLRRGEYMSLRATESYPGGSRRVDVIFKPRDQAAAKLLAAKLERLYHAQRPDELYAAALAQGNPKKEAGLMKALLAAQKTTPHQIAALHRDVGRLYGYSDDSIRSFLAANQLPDVVDEATKWGRFLDEIPSEVLDDGILKLREKGHMAPGEGLAYYVPTKGWKYYDWSQVLSLTAPGAVPAANRMLGKGMAIVGGAGLGPLSTAAKFAAGASETLDNAFGTIGEWGKAVWGWAKKNLYDKFHAYGDIDKAMEPAARARVWGAYREVQKHRDTALRVFAKLPEPIRQAMTQSLDTAGDHYHEFLKTTDGSAEAAKIVADQVMLTVKQDLAAKFPNEFLQIEEALETWQQGMRQIPPYMQFVAKNEQALAKFDPAAKAAWEESVKNPFYVPHQLSPRFQEMLDEGLFNPTTAGKINDVFTRRREFPTRKAFVKALEGLADELGFEWDGLSDLQQLDMAELYYRRMASFELTKARQGLYQDATKILGKKGGSPTAYETYIQSVLRPVGTRQNFVLKILGGGRFEVPMQDAAAAVAKINDKDWLEGLKAKVVHKEGKQYVSFYFPGLNSIWKPLLTSHPANLKFRIRNILSSAIMSQFVPGVGPEGFLAIGKALKNDGVVRLLLEGPKAWKAVAKDPALGKLLAVQSEAALTDAVKDGDYVSAAVRFLYGTTVTERDTALKVLRASGRTIGPYSWDQVADALRLVMGSGPLSPADLSAGSEIFGNLNSSITALGRHTRGDPSKAKIALDYFKKYVEWGEQLSGDIEARFRTVNMLHLLAQGRDPIEAATLINRAFVDYSKQSVVERALRDTFPFARFMIGSTPWLKNMVERPGLGLGAGTADLAAQVVSPQILGLAQRSLQGSIADEPGGGAFLPTEASGTIALPLPWRDREGNIQFLTSLGVPHEAALQMIGAAFGVDAMKKNILGAAQPVLRVPAEYIGGKSFHFGTDFGSYRKAPDYLPGALTTKIPGRDGRPDRYEIDGRINEILNMLPTAGVQSTVDRLFDGRREWWNKLLNVTTGVRTTSADLEREVKRRVAAYLRDKVSAGTIGEVQAFFARVEPENVPEDLKVMLQALAEERAQARKEAGKRTGKGYVGY